MNEYISEETPYNNIPHNDALAIKICEGLRPKPVNSDVIKTTLHSEYLDCQLDELDLNEINQDEENNIE
ncbi:unnamed protein product [Rhizophagus irregularis]|nr:unnamed protein product [Rhizophagus irregularis]CAB5168357.1 unnamed protein product [Rhizophagus irregularis]